MTVQELIEVLETVKNKKSNIKLYDGYEDERFEIIDIDLSMGDNLVDINFKSY